jgi:O-antigen/teichoic acid export membrane protein
MQPLKIRSIKVNYVLNNIRLLLNVLIPLVIFPYVSRVLGPSGLGKVEFANSIVSYFVLFTTLGIPVYGVREIARRRDDSIERSKVVWELTLILIGTMLIGYTAYFILVRLIPALYENRILYLVIAPTVFLSAFNYEWFYTGIEDQLYITIRFIVIKILQIVLIFLCVKRTDDFIIYAGISVGLNGFSAVFNIIRLKKYIHWVPVVQLNIWRHIKPILWIFSSIIAINIYIHLDVTMVGIIAGDTAVGLYTVANRIIRLVISFVISLSLVMIPRIENYLKNNDRENYKKYLDISLRFTLILGAPCCFGLIVLAPEIIQLFGGRQYTESVLAIRLLAPIIIIVGLSNFVGLQILYINRKEKYYTIAVSIAAIINFIFNFFMIPMFKQDGAILGTVLAEVIALVILIVFAWKWLQDTKLFSWNTIQYFIASIVMACVIFFISSMIKNITFNLLICIPIGLIVYFILLAILREQCTICFMNKYFRR